MLGSALREAESNAPQPSTLLVCGRPNRPPKHDLTFDEKRTIRSLEGNAACFDCNAANPDWASVSFGAMLCLHCAGRHRSYGTHVSFVRSLELDSWSDLEVRMMVLGGNSVLSDFLAEEGCALYTATNATGAGHSWLYQGPAGDLYRKRHAARCNGDEVGGPAVQSIRDCAASVPSVIPKTEVATEVIVIPASAPRWMNDSADCMLCRKHFTLLFRRHHCRRCGQCVCAECSPNENVRPILEWDMKTPVRHCNDCVKLPYQRQTESRIVGGG